MSPRARAAQRGCGRTQSERPAFGLRWVRGTSSSRAVVAALSLVSLAACWQTLDPDKPWWPARDRDAGGAATSAAPIVVQPPDLPGDGRASRCWGTPRR